MIDDSSNHPCNCKTNNCVEINYESGEIYNVKSQIKFQNTMLKSGLFDYSHAYILVKGTITVNNAAVANANANKLIKK